MAKFTKGQVAVATRFAHEPRWDEVTVVACGAQMVKVASGCPGTGYRVQVPVDEVHATKEEAFAWLCERARQRMEFAEAKLATERATVERLEKEYAVLRTPTEPSSS